MCKCNVNEKHFHNLLLPQSMTSLLVIPSNLICASWTKSVWILLIKELKNKYWRFLPFKSFESEIWSVVRGQKEKKNILCFCFNSPLCTPLNIPICWWYQAWHCKEIILSQGHCAHALPPPDNLKPSISKASFPAGLSLSRKRPIVLDLDFFSVFRLAGSVNSFKPLLKTQAIFSFRSSLKDFYQDKI